MSEQIQFSTAQLDAVRDTINVGLVSAAEMLEKLLNHEITMHATNADIAEIDNLEIFGLIPAICAKLEYAGAMSGKCAIILGQSDIKQLLNLLMNIEESPDDEDSELELDDITFNTIRELLSQMLTSYSTTLSGFLGETVQVSVNEITVLEAMTEVEKYFGCGASEQVVNLNTQFGVKDIMSSCYCMVLDNMLSELMVARICNQQAAAAQPAQKPASAQQPAGGAVDITLAKQPVQHSEPADIINNVGAQAPVRGIQNNIGPADQPQVSSEPQGSMRMQNVRFPEFAAGGVLGESLRHGNMDLLMDVPLNVTVEIGKTKKKMREIMDFTQGTVIGLEKQAGAPVDIVVNGQLIARGDVVVIDDNFAVRVTEIVSTRELGERNRNE
ncbi:MAG: flagellar motor switch protein FliN [Ruminococcus sp.]|nr:flagellar motor switch protein FliN [Ruminococcus sp.]